MATSSSAVNRSTTGSTCSVDPYQDNACRRPSSPRRYRCGRGLVSANCVSLHVPHDCGFAFVRDEELLRGVFGSSAASYVGGGADQPNDALLAPESSRTARACAVWATRRASGRG